MNKKVQAQLRAIAEMEYAQMSNEQRDLVHTESAKAGLEFNPNANCAKCYADQAILILKYYKDKEKEEAAGQSEARYVLRPNIDIIFKGIRVNEELLTDALGDRLMALGFEVKFFAKYPDAN